MSKPFQNPPTSANRMAHNTYINQRLDDHFILAKDDEEYALTPSFWRSWRVYQKSTEPKLLRAGLIMERELTREKAVLQEQRDKLDKDGKKHMQKYGVISKGSAVRQIAHRRESLFTADEMDNNAYLNRRIRETDAYITKHITGKLPRRRRTRGEKAPYDLGEPFGYGEEPPFVDYSETGLKAHYQKLTAKWEKQRKIDRRIELFHANKMDFRLASPGYEEEWVGEFGDMRVEMLARELGFVRPPPDPPSFYNDGFGNIVRLDANGEETIIGYTSKDVVVL